MINSRSCLITRIHKLYGMLKNPHIDHERVGNVCSQCCGLVYVGPVNGGEAPGMDAHLHWADLYPVKPENQNPNHPNHTVNKLLYMYFLPLTLKR